MKNNEKLPTVGNIQIRAYDEQPWEPFILGIALAVAIVKRKLPQARAWTGTEWIRISIRNHIIASLNMFDEDLEEENEETDEE